MNLPCYKCGGSGKLRSYGSRLLHTCPHCKGIGWHQEAIAADYYCGQVERRPTDNATAVEDPGQALFDDMSETLEPKEGEIDR